MESLILLACPDAAEIKRVETILSPAGYMVTSVADGAEVIKYLRHAGTPPVLLILDSLPDEMLALSCLGYLQSRPYPKPVPTLLISGEADLPFLRECMDAGLRGFLQTPYTEAQLRRDVEKLVPPKPASPGNGADEPASKRIGEGTQVGTVSAFASGTRNGTPATSQEDPSTPALTPSVSGTDFWTHEDGGSDTGLPDLDFLASDPVEEVEASPVKEPLPPMSAPAPARAAPPLHMDATGFGGEAAAEEESDFEDAPPSLADTGDASIAIGEFDEAEAGEDIAFARPEADAGSLLPLSPEMQAVLEKRLGILAKADAMEATRKARLQDESITDAARAVYQALSLELKKIPRGTEARKRLEGLNEKIHSFRESAETGERPPPPPDLEAAWQMAQIQRRLWVERDALWKEIRKAAVPYLLKEPLFRLLLTFKFPAESLFGHAIYHLALEAEQARLSAARKGLQKNLNQLDGQSRGLLGAFRKTDDDKRESLAHTTAQVQARLSSIQRELQDLEPVLVREFWRCYELAACLYVSGKVPSEGMLLLRALLRYGLLGQAPHFLAPDVLAHLLQDVQEDVITAWDTTMAASRVFYADEYIHFAVRGEMTESIHEDLELTQRNSPAWSADKARRRIAFSNLQEAALHEAATELTRQIAALRAKREGLEAEQGSLIHSAKDFKQRRSALAQSIQHCRVEAARLERAIERIQTKYLVDVDERRMMAQDKLRGSGVTRSAFDIAREEVAGIHRVCRLCAKLHDPFLPFVLRDNYKLGTDAVHDRKTMREALAKVEASDTTLFKDVLINSRKMNQRVYLRYHPIFLITPSCGFLPYSWNPRVGVEIGRLVFPGYAPRPGMRDRMLYQMLSDFRWDTSKAAAGVDLLTSDTLVAGYATVRWEYRKKNKVNREKALIFNELNDRQNWRRHYELFLQCAHDGGRKLFFKNNEVYEMIVKYLGLPEGVERLRR